MPWDIAVGGLWAEDVENIEKLYPGYELVAVDGDGHHYTAFLRRKR